MYHQARHIAVAVLLLMLLAGDGLAQVTDSIPRASYFLSKEVFYSGEYRDAERNLRRERGVRFGQSTWIDSICLHAMLGEVLYHEGRNREALAEFDQACQVFLANPDWLLQVKFQSTTSGMRADTNRIRRSPPWGQSSRTFVVGQFADTEQVLVGDLNASQSLQTGGAFRAPMYWRVNVAEIMRSTALAIRRRNDLLGPLSSQDALSKQLSGALASNKLAPANHWTNAWIDVLRGLAQVGMGKLDEADMLLGRALVVEGQFDHPLTCVALLGQARIAMTKGDSRRAGLLFAEAGFSAFYFDDWGVLTEATLGGWLNHVASHSAGLYPPLESIAAWSQANRLQHLAIKSRLAQAESLLWMGQISNGAALVEDTGRRMAGMRGGLPTVQHVFLQGVVALLQGRAEQGSETLSRALSLQSNVSLRNFQIGLTNQSFDNRSTPARTAAELYQVLLSDPTPLDWACDPLDVMAVLKTGQDAAFDRWFIAAVERKDASLAFEITERAKRRRYLATQPFGGRLLALRAVLETPVSHLSQEAVLQRQQILSKFPEYRTLSDAGVKAREQLLGGPILPANAADTKVLNRWYEAWEDSAVQRQQMLTQLAARRLASSLEFPPLRRTAEVQQSLTPDEALLAFHNVGGNVYGLLLNRTETRLWQLPDARRLRAGLADSLKAIGNYGANRQLSVAELESNAWREASKTAFTTVFNDVAWDVTKIKSVVIVPDDVLWYLPFEILIPTGPNAAVADDRPFADRFPVRYGPTAALAIAQARPLRRGQHTGIVANDLAFGVDNAERSELLQQLADSFTGPLVLTRPLPAAPNLISALLEQLVVMDDLAELDGEAASLLPAERGSGRKWLNHLIAMPFGGPEHIVLTGMSTEAEQGLKASKRSSRSGASQPEGTGGEVFQFLCNLMAGGGRTVLMTRWRTSGRTNFDLVREYAKELPHATSASEAWQRASLLAREAPLDVHREPRLKRSEDSGEILKADHPFFWGGYLLVDTGPAPASAEVQQPDNVPIKEGAGQALPGKTLPPPVKPDGPAPDKGAGENPPSETGSQGESKEELSPGGAPESEAAE